jgi:hypothetical protein
MDFKMQNGQAQQPQRPAATGGSFGSAGGAGVRKLIAVVVGVLVIVALVIGTLLFSKSDNSTASSAKVDANAYQAIFLTNGQVYFGKLSDVNNGYVNIKDVYYLQVQQAVQPADAKASADQVLFWENLKGDSTVVKAITDYKKKQ